MKGWTSETDNEGPAQEIPKKIDTLFNFWNGGVLILGFAKKFRIWFWG